MRGLRVLLTETSTVDPYSGIKFRGQTINDCLTTLPAPLPESLYWLLLTGQAPSPTQTEEIRQEIQYRSELPPHTIKILDSLPAHMHPMTQLSIGVLSLSTSNSP